ncbi:hypothetical protein Q4555_06725 [Octadecabacter sp. 1_MG-2023]|uniref:hypothetical protein n=1 Tax=unclassified Octadecabacter TaxID=196158 RepID=UPI001C0A48B3|nr:MULTISPECIES: hypothetical protein [unclassified Octadecabacter]MBU2994356.1 hypothetical protein [Octadecabacter sp. B2R22]MDO6734355.1 hypothetical protein [Octadecabacter sp. 1_MG-2023]
MKSTILTLSALIAVSACSETTTTPDPIEQAVSGRTLVSGDTRLTAGANGALVGTLASGDTLSGTWRIGNGKWCRTLTQPARFAGAEVCQDAALAGDQLVIVGSNGTPTTYSIE